MAEHPVFHAENDQSPTSQGADTLSSASADLSDMTVDRIVYHGRSLILDPPLTLKPSIDESGQLYTVVDECLGVHVFAPNRLQLAREIAEQLLFLWDTYAREDPERMTAAAQQLRRELLKRLKEAA